MSLISFYWNLEQQNREAEKQRDGQECYWEILCLPQPESPHSRISPPGEEEGCDQQPGWISIIQLGLLLTTACFTPCSLPNAQLWLVYCPITGQGDILYIHLAFTLYITATTSHRSRLLLQQTVQTWLGVIAEVSDYRLARLSPAALSAD